MGCQSTGAGFLCRSCRDEFEDEVCYLDCGLKFHALGNYEGVLKQCILKAKLKGQRQLATELGNYAAEFAQECFSESESVYVMPIPSSSEGARFRGFSLPQIITTALREVGPVFQSLSVQEQQAFRGQRLSSKGLSREERLQRSVSEKTDEPSPRKLGTLLLVDDVVTTGATMAGAFRTAQSLGWSEIVGLVLARVRRT